MSRHAQETGFTSSGPINMGSQKITSLATGTSSGDAVNKGQMDAAMPIGAIIAFGGTSGFDTNVWALCDGTAHGSTALQAVIGSANAPDLRGLFVVGAGKNGNTSLAPTTRTHGTTGGAESVALATNQLPSHNHTGTTDSGGVAHTHPVTGNTGDAGGHSHTGTTGNDNADHTHGVSGYVSGTNVGGYRINWLSDADDGGSGLMMGRSTDGAAYGDHNHYFSATSGGRSAYHQHGFTTGPQSDHSHAVSLTSGAASATNHTHTFTSGNTGSGATHENMPPFYVVTYLIKKA